MTYKRDIFHLDARMKQMRVQHGLIQMAMFSGGGVVNPILHLTVDRSNVIKDALTQIANYHGSQFLKPLRITFKGEDGIDEGGLRREFFRVIKIC